MAKRTDRLKSIDHEINQLEALKGLTPNATPEEYQQLSAALVDVAIHALKIVHALEAGAPPQFEPLYDRVDSLDETIS